MQKDAKNVKGDLSTMKGFEGVLKNYHNAVSKLLQTKFGISPEEFLTTCVTAVKKNPKLLKCTPHSLFGCILLCAEVGLKPNTPDQHCFIIPYNGEAKFQIGYQGIIERLYRIPRINKVDSQVVFEKDDFDYAYGLDPFLHHKPYRGKDRGKLVATYTVVKLNDADPIFTVVEHDELAQVEAFSASKNSKFSPYTSGADVHHYMQKKVGIKKIVKLLPKQNTEDVSKAIYYDSKFEGGASVSAPILLSDGQDAVAQLVDGVSLGSLEGSFDDISHDTAPLNFQAPQNTSTQPIQKENSMESTFDDVDFEKVGEVKESAQEKKQDAKDDSDKKNEKGNSKTSKPKDDEDIDLFGTLDDVKGDNKQPSLF